jgi:hypothetical protein
MNIRKRETSDCLAILRSIAALPFECNAKPSVDPDSSLQMQRSDRPSPKGYALVENCGLGQINLSCQEILTHPASNGQSLLSTQIDAAECQLSLTAAEKALASRA